MAMTVAQALEEAVEHHRAGRLREAELLYRQILVAVPEHHDALHLLGLVAHQSHHFESAAELIARAIDSSPRQSLFHYHLGVVRAAQKRHAEAEKSLRTAIEFDPRLRGPRTELGLSLIGQRRWAEAAAELRDALELDPGDSIAARNLGACCSELGLMHEAEEVTRRAVELEPGNAAGWNNLGGILISRGEPAAAATCYEEACKRDPAFHLAYSNRLMCEQYLPGGTEERLLELSVAWQERYAPSVREAFPAPPNPGTHRGLRLGFVSPDINRTPMGYFLVGLLEALRGEAVTVVAYSDTAREDDLTGRIRRTTSLWRDTRSMSDEQLLKSVRGDAIDVLFDLAGHTKDNRLPVFARRAAPVQVTWAGYVGTTGLEAIDYLLADRFHVPVASERFYRERVLRMPHGYVCYEPPFYAPNVAPLPALSEGRITFGAFHNVAKVGEPSIAAWAGVMAGVPGSRLVLRYTNLDEPRTRQRILHSFAATGIAAERIVIEGTSPHVDMLRRYNEVDIALDSRPYSGGLTTCEALWMGVPVVTLPGQTFAGRHSLSHLSNAGHPELVAKDIEDYVRIAVRLASDLPVLAAIRSGLRAKMASSPLCDARMFARDFLAAVRLVARTG